MVIDVCFAVGVFLTLYSAYALHRSTRKEKVTIPAVKPVEIECPKPYVRIGKVDASFNKELHQCQLPRIGQYEDETKGWDIGTVIACTVPECGQEWVLGYYQESFEEKKDRIDSINMAYDARNYPITRDLYVKDGKFYSSSMMPVLPKEITKKWYTMEQYEVDPDKYVYFV